MFPFLLPLAVFLTVCLSCQKCASIFSLFVIGNEFFAMLLLVCAACGCLECFSYILFYFILIFYLLFICSFWRNFCAAAVGRVKVCFGLFFGCLNCQIVAMFLLSTEWVQL